MDLKFLHFPLPYGLEIPTIPPALMDFKFLYFPQPSWIDASGLGMPAWPWCLKAPGLCPEMKHNVSPAPCPIQEPFSSLGIPFSPHPLDAALVNSQGSYEGA